MGLYDAMCSVALPISEIVRLKLQSACSTCWHLPDGLQSVMGPAARGFEVQHPGCLDLTVDLALKRCFGLLCKFVDKPLFFDMLSSSISILEESHFTSLSAFDADSEVGAYFTEHCMFYPLESTVISSVCVNIWKNTIWNSVRMVTHVSQMNQVCVCLTYCTYRDINTYTDKSPPNKSAVNPWLTSINSKMGCWAQIPSIIRWNVWVVVHLSHCFADVDGFDSSFFANLKVMIDLVLNTLTPTISKTILDASGSTFLFGLLLCGSLTS